MNIKIDAERREVYAGKKEVFLAPKEFSILSILAQADGRVISREELIEKIWSNKNPPADSRTIDQHVARLRRKLEIWPTPVVTVPSFGYKLKIKK